MVLRKRRKRQARICLYALVVVLAPVRTGFDGLGALLASQPGVIERAREHLIASPFGTIHAAMFSLPRPLGTAIPHPPIYALANFDPTDATGSIGSQFLGDGSAPLRFPAVNRKDKGDSLLTRRREPLPPMPPLLAIAPVPDDEADAAIKPDDAPPRIDPYADYEFGAPDEPQSASVAPPPSRAVPKSLAKLMPEAAGGDSLYFGGEPVRGQIAVAQVVMNRVFSPFYPNDVCGVVYQNSARRNACPFTFTCDGIPDVVTEPDAWARAKHIARDMLDGKLWMPEVAKATHYHAYWVHPDWVNEMNKIYKLGTHIFYRPRDWGDGSDQPVWGNVKLTEKEAVDDEKRWPVSYSEEWLNSPDGRAWARENAKK